MVKLKKAKEPRQPRLLAVVGVQDHGHSIQLGDLAHMKRTRHGARNAGGIIRVVSGLARQELATTLGEGDHHRATSLLGRLHASVHGAGAHHIHTGDGELVLLATHGASSAKQQKQSLSLLKRPPQNALLLGVVQQIHQGLASDHSGLHRGGHLGEGLLCHRGALAHHLAAPRLARTARLGTAHCNARGTQRQQT